MTGGEEPTSGAAVPTVVVLILVAVAGSVPLLYPAGPVAETPRYVLLWALAALAFVYVLLSAWRVYRNHGLRTTVKWLATGSLPRK